jgi:hypothetical protein
MRETGGNSPSERALLLRLQGADTSSWSIKNDITQDSLESIFEDAEDLFT